ncbi:hypothetical protein AC629_04375 [Bradyrhizobium sp. NAS80.1]|nr:hypothetical protein AC629_04375 [Bradyrhizobium sp. NAS80.1]
MSTAATSLPERSAVEAADLVPELKAAYQRIEELAELDELAGSCNRRCIMRLLDAKIARADGALYSAKAHGRNRITTS